MSRNACGCTRRSAREVAGAGTRQAGEPGRLPDASSATAKIAQRRAARVVRAQAAGRGRRRGAPAPQPTERAGDAPGSTSERSDVSSATTPARDFRRSRSPSREAASSVQAAATQIAAGFGLRHELRGHPELARGSATCTWGSARGTPGDVAGTLRLDSAAETGRRQASPGGTSRRSPLEPMVRRSDVSESQFVNTHAFRVERGVRRRGAPRRVEQLRAVPRAAAGRSARAGLVRGLPPSSSETS